MQAIDNLKYYYVKRKIINNANMPERNDLNNNEDMNKIKSILLKEPISIIVNFKIGFSYSVDCKTKGISYISEKRNLGISLQLNIESEK